MGSVQRTLCTRMMTHSEPKNNIRRPGWALLCTIPVPTVAVVVHMWLFPQESWSRVFFLGCKLWVLLAPMVFMCVLGRGKPTFPAFHKAGMGWAMGFGVVSFLAIVMGWLVLGERTLGTEGVAHFRKVIHDFGMSTPLLFVGAAVGYSFVNSLLEEYVWRWFGVSQARRLMPWLGAAVLINLAFGVHHFFAVAKQTEGFGYLIPSLAMAGCVGGGFVWSWIYKRSGNLWAAWVAHVWADLGVFTVGYLIAFG